MTDRRLDALLATLPRRSVAVEADLSVTVDGEPFTVRTAGETPADRVVVTAPSLRAALRLRRRAGGPGTLAALERTGLTAVLRVGRRTVGLAGADADPGAIERLLGLGPVELRVGNALRAVLG